MCLPVTPHKTEREWKHAGLSCAVVQAFEAGHRCGYVRVPPGHPLHGKAYDGFEVEVHGDLTFAEIEPCSEHEDGQGWWFGFDCDHCMDASFDPALTPEAFLLLPAFTQERIANRTGFESQFPGDVFPREHYWTQPEVEAETERLAEQIAALS